MKTFLGIIMLGLLAGGAQSAEKLGSYNIDKNAVSVSGLSSGGYMAGQFHVAYSQKLMGAAVLTAGPYYCAGGSPLLALGRCTDAQKGEPELDAEEFIAFTHKAAAGGHIDAVEHMREDKVWVYVAANDNTVERPVSDALIAYYDHFVEADNFSVMVMPGAEHGFPTTDRGAPCGTKKSPFINDCDFDGAGTLLGHIYGELKPKTAANGQLIKFKQREFENSAQKSLNKYGHLYVPQACADGEECKLHVAFHGCKQTDNFIGDAYYTDTGYNTWAESNNILVLYPQARPSHTPFNPNGCWDWWGYNDAKYYRKTGNQMAAVNRMIERLQGQR